MTGSDGDGDETPSDLSRRFLLGGIATTGALAGLSDEAAGWLGRSEPTVGTDDTTTDPHTEATFRAFAAAVIPATPDLARRRGSEHEPGAEAVGVAVFVIWFLNRSLEPKLYRLSDTRTTVRLAEAVAELLDAGAAALLARGENEQEPDAARSPAGGPFASLAPDDRFRAIEQLESLSPDDVPAPIDRFDDQIGYIVQAIHLVVTAGYYTEWAGYGDTWTADPSERQFTDPVQSHAQTEYPGPIPGAADHRGYEVQEFRENEYSTDDGSRRGDPRPAGGDADDTLPAGGQDDAA